MIIDSTLTKTDYSKMCWNLILRNKTVWFTFVPISILFILAYIWFIDFFFIILEIIFVVLIFGNHWLIIYRRTNSKENSKWFSLQQFEFKDDTVLITTEFSKEELKWNAFIKWRYISGQYLLYVSNITMYAINERDVKDKQQFESMLKEKIKK
jgi:hypothetical protein